MSTTGNTAREASGDFLSPDAFSPITRMRKDGTLTFRGSYSDAVIRLFEYECCGILPEDAKAGHVREHWERYTFRLPYGRIYPRRGCSLVLGRLWAYETSGLTPRVWAEQYGSKPGTK